MTAFLLQDIPGEVAEYAGRMARSTRRGMNDVLLEMLARAAAQSPHAAATPHAAPAAAQPGPAMAAELGSAPKLAPATASAAEPPTAQPQAQEAMTAPAADADPESLALFEAMQAAQSIPSG